MLKLEEGPFLYQFSKAAASLNFTPVADRGALVRRIGITAVSASDTWVISSKGKPVMAVRVNATGNQNILRMDDQATMPHTDFFSFCREYLNMDPSIPVPLGQVLTIASVGGATANISIEFEEHDTSDLSTAMLNHPDGKEWLFPITTWLNAAVAATGVINDDTMVAPSWLPNFLIGTLVTSAWKLQLLAMVMEGVGVNTFSGAANHQSTTNTKQFVYNGRKMFSRTNSGVPNVGTASAAGSANTVFGQVMGSFNPWERANPTFDDIFSAPIVLQNGDTFNVQEEIIGDVTGGAAYVGATTIFVARVSEVQ